MNKTTKIFHVCSIYWCLLSVFVASLYSQNKANSLSEIQAANQAYIEKINTPIDELNKHYRDALFKLQEQAQKSKDSNASIAISEELARHARLKNPPEKLSEIKALEDLQKVYARNYLPKIGPLKIQLGKAKESYKRQLAALINRLVAAGRQDEAAKVKIVLAEIDAPTGGGSVQFKEKLSDKEYQQQLTRSRIDFAEIKKDTRSPYGSLVMSVSPDSVAEGLGIRPNDRIIKVGEKYIWHQYVDWDREAPRRTLIWETADGTRKSEKIPPGKIGTFGIGDLVFYRLYLESGNRSKSWDDFLLTALLAAEADPDLAETAMYKAMSAGYPSDSISSSVGILIALRNNHPGEAADIAEHIVKQAKDSDSEIAPAMYPLLYRAWLAAGKLDLLEQADRKFGDEFSRLSEDRWPEFLSAWKAVHPEWKISDRPSAKLEESDLKDDVFQKRKLITDFLSPKVADIPRTQKGPDFFTVTPGRFISSFHIIEGGLQDFVWETKFAAEPNGKSPPGNRSFPLIEFTVLNYLEGARQPLVKAQFMKSEAGQHRLQLSGGQQKGFHPYFLTQWLDKKDDDTASLRIIRKGNEVEVQLNGATQLWLPLDPKVKIEEIGFAIKAFGMIVNFKETHLWQLP